MTFLTLVSGLSGAELPPLLGRYLALRGKAADRGGARVAMGEEEGLAFLTWRFHQRQLRDGRAGRIGEVLAGGSVVRPAPEVKVSDELFLPPDDPSGDPSKGAGVLVRRRAVTNRFRDRFQLTPELEALLTILSGGEESDGGRAWQEVERRFCERFGIARDAHRDALRRWVELLADHALVEWGPPGRPPGRPPAAAAAGREAS